MTRISDRLFLEMFNKLTDNGKKKVICLLQELQNNEEDEPPKEFTLAVDKNNAGKHK